MWHALDTLGFLSALVLFLTAIRLFEVSHHFEVSLRIAVAGFVGIGAAWSMAAAICPGHLHPAHVAVLVGAAVWIAHTVWKDRHIPSLE